MTATITTTADTADSATRGVECSYYDLLGLIADELALVASTLNMAAATDVLDPALCLTAAMVATLTVDIFDATGRDADAAQVKARLEFRRRVEASGLRTLADEERVADLLIRTEPAGKVV